MLTIEKRAKVEEFKSRECHFSVLGILGEISGLSTRDMENSQEGMGSNVTCSQEDRKDNVRQTSAIGSILRADTLTNFCVFSA